MTRFAAALLTLLCLSTAHAADMAEQGQHRANEFASNGMNFTLKACKLPDTCSGKKPISQKKVVRETGNDSVIEERNLEFDGLAVDLGYGLEYPKGTKSKNPYQHPFIEWVKITDPSWPVEHGLHVGVTREAIIQALGKGGGADNMINYVNEAKQDMVTFMFRNNRVESIEWSRWNDR